MIRTSPLVAKTTSQDMGGSKLAAMFHVTSICLLLFALGLVFQKHNCSMTNSGPGKFVVAVIWFLFGSCFLPLRYIGVEFGLKRLECFTSCRRQVPHGGSGSPLLVSSGRFQLLPNRVRVVVEAGSLTLAVRYKHTSAV